MVCFPDSPHVDATKQTVLPAAALGAMDASCLIGKPWLGRWFGSSGVLVDASRIGGPKHCIMTAAHALKSPGPHTRIYFRYERHRPATEWVEAALAPDVFHVFKQDGAVDFAFVAVAPSDVPALLARGVAPLPLPTMSVLRRLAHGSEVTIWQHPLDERFCGIPLGGGFKMFTSGSIAAIDGSRLTYHISTKKYSSGSPLVLAGTSTLVGIHAGKATASTNKASALAAVLPLARAEAAALARVPPSARRRSTSPVPTRRAAHPSRTEVAPVGLRTGPIDRLRHWAVGPGLIVLGAFLQLAPKFVVSSNLLVAGRSDAERVARSGLATALLVNLGAEMAFTALRPAGLSLRLAGVLLLLSTAITALHTIVAYSDGALYSTSTAFWLQAAAGALTIPVNQCTALWRLGQRRSPAKWRMVGWIVSVGSGISAGHSERAALNVHRSGRLVSRSRKRMSQRFRHSPRFRDSLRTQPS